MQAVRKSGLSAQEYSLVSSVVLPKEENNKFGKIQEGEGERGLSREIEKIFS